jgi:hypothetical protein
MLSIIKSSIVQFHIKHDGFRLYNPNQIFGVFFLELNPTSMIKCPQFVYSGNDMSGSMSDLCKDGRTKMQHLQLTLENIVHLFSKNADSVNITLEITGFDNQIEEVILPTKIKNDCNQMDEINAKIKSVLRPRSTTNIELALNDAKTKLDTDNDNDNDNQDKSFIFMTDGNITDGSISVRKLKSQVPTHSRNYFIGFGADHDFKLLQKLASVGNGGSYYYVDKIENAGLVFGEIIHSILYTALKNVQITVENGEIYDFEKNEWTQQIVVPYLCGEANKQYHVRSETPDQFEIRYSAYDVSVGEMVEWTEQTLPYLVEDDGTIVETDLRKYMYRQRTLELLAETMKDEMNFMDKMDIQKKLRDFRIELETFAKEYTDPTDIQFMKQLCDDLYISETTIHSAKSMLYTIARQRAQGRGDSYNITHIEREDYYYEDEENNDYEISQESLNITTTITQAEIMRECSQTQRII